VPLREVSSRRSYPAGSCCICACKSSVNIPEAPRSRKHTRAHPRATCYGYHRITSRRLMRCCTQPFSSMGNLSKSWRSLPVRLCLQAPVFGIMLVPKRPARPPQAPYSSARHSFPLRHGHESQPFDLLKVVPSGGGFTQTAKLYERAFRCG
jgi:hypothetical protein